MIFMLECFDVLVRFGRDDAGESFIDMELTEEEYERIQEAKESGEDFAECESVADIYERACEIADDVVSKDLIGAGWLKKGQKASEVYPVEVYFESEDDDDDLDYED
jgi:hypothetical protein